MSRIRYEILERDGIYKIRQWESVFLFEVPYTYFSTHTSIENAQASIKMFIELDKADKERKVIRKKPWKKVWP